MSLLLFCIEWFVGGAAPTQWRVLDEIGTRDGRSAPPLIARLYDELTEAHGDVAAFSVFLRVSWLHYLSL